MVDKRKLPRRGTPVTVVAGTDRYSGKVHKVVVKGKQPPVVIVQRCKVSIKSDAVAPNAVAGAVYDCSLNNSTPTVTITEPTHGRLYEFTLRKNGEWVLKGEDKDKGIKLKIGESVEHFDDPFGL